LCITLPKEEVDILFARRPSSIEVGWKTGTVVEWNNEKFCRKTEFHLSDYQKDLIQNGGSVGVMVRMAAELQKEGKLD
jgi:hypothetical protein